MKNKQDVQTKIAWIGMLLKQDSALDKILAVVRESQIHVLAFNSQNYEDKAVGLVTLVVDAFPDEISGLAGKLGMLPGVKVKSMENGI